MEESTKELIRKYSDIVILFMQILIIVMVTLTWIFVWGGDKLSMQKDSNYYRNCIDPNMMNITLS